MQSRIDFLRQKADAALTREIRQERVGLIERVTDLHESGGRRTRICDMDSIWLLNTVKKLMGSHRVELYAREARRRNLIGERPTFAELHDRLRDLREYERYAAEAMHPMPYAEWRRNS